MPYIANLENGRGNPTLAAVSRLAAALGVSLEVRLERDDSAAASTALPDSLVQFSRGARFQAEVARLSVDGAARLSSDSAAGLSGGDAARLSSGDAARLSSDDVAWPDGEGVARVADDGVRSRLLEGMAAMGAVADRPLEELDWHRMLDVIVLVTRGA